MAILKREETASTRSAVPTAPSAEKAAISIILQNYEVLDAAKWDADLFFEHANRALLSAAKECHNEGFKSDIFRLQAVLEEKGMIFDVGGYHGVTEAFTAYPTGDAVAALDFRKDLMKARRYRKAMRAKTTYARCGPISTASLNTWQTRTKNKRTPFRSRNNAMTY
jgi:replicative DNA helicase